MYWGVLYHVTCWFCGGCGDCCPDDEDSPEFAYGDSSFLIFSSWLALYGGFAGLVGVLPDKFIFAATTNFGHITRKQPQIKTRSRSCAKPIEFDFLFLLFFFLFSFIFALFTRTCWMFKFSLFSCLNRLIYFN